MDWAMKEKSCLLAAGLRAGRDRSARLSVPVGSARRCGVAQTAEGSVVRATAVWLCKSPAGQWVNWKKLYRIYREERLTVRKRGGRKRAIGTRAPMAIPQGPNQRWSLDFV